MRASKSALITARVYHTVYAMSWMYHRRTDVYVYVRVCGTHNFGLGGRNVVSWTTVIAGAAVHMETKNARRVYRWDDE